MLALTNRHLLFWGFDFNLISISSQNVAHPEPVPSVSHDGKKYRVTMSIVDAPAGMQVHSDEDFYDAPAGAEDSGTDVWILA